MIPPGVAKGNVPDEAQHEYKETLLHKLINTAADDVSALRDLEENLKEWKPLINIRCSDTKETALLLAIWKELEGVTAELLQEGVDPELEDDSGWLPLQAASDVGNETIIEALLSAGADAAKRGHDGQYPLDGAVRWPLKSQLMRQLVKPHEQSINKVYKESEWPLLNRAVYHGTESAIDLLLEVGASLSMVDFEKWTPLMTAIRRNYPKIVAKLLRNLVGQAPKDIQSAIDTPGLDGITPIMLICGGTVLDDGAGNSLTASDIITDLLKLGPDINAIDVEENTVLHHAMNAAAPRDENLIKCLIQLMRPERILQSNIRGETAFDSCFDKDEDCPFSESRDLIQFLIELFAPDQTLQQAEEPLCWTVYRLERHTTALALFSKLKQAGKIRGNFDPHGCSLVEWAIHARLPRVLLTYLRAVGLYKKGDKDSPVGEDRERGLNLVRRLTAETQASLPWPSEPDRQRRQAEQKSSDQSRDGDPDLKDLKDLEDILDYLYPEKAERRASPWALSEQTEPMKATSQRFPAAIIQNNFFKFRNVHEILYDSDQMENVRQTVERLQKFEYNPNPHKQASPHVSGVNFKVGPDFTWIHLPASNITWMEDAVKKVLKQMDCKDEAEKVASFLRSSWIEIPDRTSTSRFMRPRYVVKDKSLPTDSKDRRVAKDISDEDMGWHRFQANEERQYDKGFFSPVDNRNMTSLGGGNREDRKNKGKSTEQTMGHLSSTLGKVARQLCDIKDIRDELNILKTVATFQRKVQYQMAGPSANGDLETDYILSDIREMDRFAEQTQEAVKTTLTLVESDIANLQGMEAVKQGKIVLIFTLVTVWFLPLSFLTSLFALDVASFLTAPAWSLYVIFVVPLLFLLVAIAYVWKLEIVQYYSKMQRNAAKEFQPAEITRAKSSALSCPPLGVLRRRGRADEEHGVSSNSDLGK
ncbi:Homeobox protein Wariai [Colletotrichum fructicola]|nr:Homeobox protein Wariai [Colletotrichum fructicola]